MPKSDGYKNLITPSTDEARERGTKGGIASGKVRREKRSMREALDILLKLSLKDGKKTDIKNIKSLTSLSGQNVTVQDALLIAQIQKALKGDGRAFDAIKNIVMPTETEGVQTQDKATDGNKVVIEIVGRKNGN